MRSTTQTPSSGTLAVNAKGLDPESCGSGSASRPSFTNAPSAAFSTRQSIPLRQMSFSSFATDVSNAQAVVESPKNFLKANVGFSHGP